MLVMEVKGFKAFSRNMTNHYGTTFEENKLYTINKDIPIEYGKNGAGFHFSKNMEDTLRYVDGMNEEIYIASVIASGEIVPTNNYEDVMYYEYDDVYAARNIYIDHIYTREEILNYFLSLDGYYGSDRLIRFLRGYKLTEEEIQTMKQHFKIYTMVMRAIEYYQVGDLDTFNKLYRRKR